MILMSLLLSLSYQMQLTNMKEQLLTRTLLAQKLSCSERHIQNLEKKGLPVIWVGAIPRYEYREVIKWLSSYYKKQDAERREVSKNNG